MSWSRSNQAARSAVTGGFFLLGSMVAQAQMPGAQPGKPVPLPHPEIAAPSFPEPGLPFWVYVLGGVSVLAIMAVLLWLLLRTSKATGAPGVPPLKRALDRLHDLSGELDQVPPSEVAHRVSVILREYQEGRYAVPAPYRTSEELYQAVDPALKAGVQERFGPLSAVYDRLAFAPVPSSRRDAKDLIEAARSALQHDSETPRAQVAAPAISEPEPSPAV